MTTINCVFNKPLYYGNSVDAFLPVLGSRNEPTYHWNYSGMDCTSTEPVATSTMELIRDNITGSEFYLDKTINYGEILGLTFLLLFAIFGIIKVIGDFFIPHRFTTKS